MHGINDHMRSIKLCTDPFVFLININDQPNSCGSKKMTLVVDFACLHKMEEKPRQKKYGYRKRREMAGQN